MRGLGDFQRAQMKPSDPRIGELFHHLRSAVDILERLTLEAVTQVPEPLKSAPEPSKATPQLEKSGGVKLAYSIKEVCQIAGISHTTIYKAIATKKLRAVKRGYSTKILKSDLDAWVQSWPASK